MPLKLNLGLQKKVGLPDYGSVGASCHVEIELDSTLINQDLEAFHRHIRNAYVACSQAVNDELARQQAARGNGKSQTTVEPSATTPQPSMVASFPSPPQGNGNGNGNGHQPSQKQLDYLQQLARQVKGLGARRLELLAERMFGKPLVGMTSFEASALIDQLKAIKGGTVQLDDILGNGVAT